MAKLFADQAMLYSDPVRFTTPGRYSMPVAVEILQQLELREDCEIRNTGWKSAGYGDLVEVGIPVRLGTVEFEIMCSYEDIFFRRLSGNKAKFYEFCEGVRDMDLVS
jgi:hypothetical protein